MKASLPYKTPVSVQFELTPRCNFDCKMCYVHNQDSNKLKSKELSTDQWKSIMDDAFSNGMMFETLTGGKLSYAQGDFPVSEDAARNVKLVK